MEEEPIFTHTNGKSLTHHQSPGSNHRRDRQLLHPLCHDDPRGVRDILTRDWISRKERKWPLVPLCDFSFYQTAPNAADFLDADTQLHSCYHGFCLLGNKAPIDVTHLQSTNLKDLLFETFPHLHDLFEKYAGKIALCGGALTRLLCKSDIRNTDVDLFFYGEHMTTQEATLILEDCVATICSSARNSATVASVRMDHKMHVTNIELRNISQSQDDDGDKRKRKYQFIHRVYPSMDRIIGGFDFGPCMLAFDGNSFYATELGAWCIAKKALIVDTTRRSVSFNYRIEKYLRLGFHVVYAGLLKHNEATRAQVSADEIFSSNLSIVNELLKGHKGADLDQNTANLQQLLDQPSNMAAKQHPPHNYASSSRHRLNNVGLYKTTPDIALAQRSDYSDKQIPEQSIAKANGTMLRLNKLDGVFVHATIQINGTPLSYDGALATFRDLVDQPCISYDANYVEDVTRYISRARWWSHTYRQAVHAHINEEVSYFAEHAPTYRKLINSPHNDMHVLGSIIVLLNQRMHENARKCQRNLQGIRWITEHPERQWTSSINPIIEDPRDYYGKDRYVPFHVGMPQAIETTLRCIREFRPVSALAVLPNDVFKLLLKYVVCAYTFNLNVIPNEETEPDPSIQLAPTFSSIIFADSDFQEARAKYQLDMIRQDLHIQQNASHLLNLVNLCLLSILAEIFPEIVGTDSAPFSNVEHATLAEESAYLQHNSFVQQNAPDLLEFIKCNALIT